MVKNMFQRTKYRLIKGGVIVGTICAIGSYHASAALTVVPADIYTGVESGFDAAALIGVAIAGVMWTIRFVKKGLKTA